MRRSRHAGPRQGYDHGAGGRVDVGYRVTLRRGDQRRRGRPGADDRLPRRGVGHGVDGGAADPRILGGHLLEELPAVELAHLDGPEPDIAGEAGMADRDLALPLGVEQEIGRASWRERVGQYVEISVVAVSLKKKKK